MYSCFVGTAFSEVGEETKSPNVLAGYNDEAIELLAQKCKSTGDVIELENQKVLCISSKIRMDKIDWEYLETIEFDFTFVNSASGGGVLSAIKLGRIIYNQNLPILVSGFCLSSCANYLIPASPDIRILENSYVGFHGTPDRTEKKYLKEFHTSSIERNEERQGFFRESINKELNYFYDIGINENYATFFYHSALKLRSQEQHKCKPSNSLFYVLGPKHSKAYNLPIGDSWFPKSRKEFNLLIQYLFYQSYVYDLDSEPFYIAGKGFTNPKKCRISVTK